MDAEQGSIPDEFHPRLEQPLSQRLIALGFDAQAPVYGVGEFNRAMLVDATFETTRSQPRVIPFSYYHGPNPWQRTRVILPMEVELLQVVRVHYDAGGVRCVSEEPEWYIRGWLGQCEINPDGNPVRMHTYIAELDREQLNSMAYVQMLRERPTQAPAFSLDGLLLEADRDHSPVVA
jgi:hypothetical protein